MLTGAERQQQLMLLQRGRVCRATVDGRPVAHVTTAAAMRTKADAWLSDESAPHGVVVKLTLDRSNRAVVVLSDCG